MSGDLKNAVRRGVDDQRPGAQMFFSIVANNIGARIGLVTEHAAPGQLGEACNERVWEAVREGRQGGGGDKTGDFPVSDGGVFAHGRLPHAGKRRAGRGNASAYTFYIEKSERGEVRAVESGVAADAAQGVAALIAEMCRVGRGADAHGVENNQKQTFYHNSAPFMAFVRGGYA